MSPAKWNPDQNLLGPFANWIDDFFADRADWLRFPWKNGETLPAVNISETKDAWQLEVAAPGFKKSDFKLEVKNGRITISAEKEEKSEKVEDGTVTRREFIYNSFSRAFTLPENARADGIAANYTEGLLKVAVPKKKQEEPASQTIAVQ